MGRSSDATTLQLVRGFSRVRESNADTLAALILALEPSARCFSCDSGLLVWSASADRHGILICPSCGAEVDAEETTEDDNAAKSALFVAA